MMNYTNPPQSMNPGFGGQGWGNNPGIGYNSGANPMNQGIRSSYGAVWKWDCEDGNKTPYDANTSQYIESCFSTGQDCVFMLQTDKGPKKYRIDFQAMKQINVDTQFQKRVFRE